MYVYDNVVGSFQTEVVQRVLKISQPLPEK